MVARRYSAVHPAIAAVALAIVLSSSGSVLAASSTRPQGLWSPINPWPNISTHTSLLPNGKVLAWEDGDTPNYVIGRPGNTRAHLIDIPLERPPLTTFVAVTNTKTNMFCSGHTFLPDGRVIVTGGRAVTPIGVPDINLFDYRTSSWRTLSGLPASYARWYASAVSLGTGDVLFLAGNRNGFTDPNLQPQVWRAADGSVRDLSSAMLKLQNYPMTFLAPDGRVFVAGPEKRTLFLDTAGTGTWADGPNHLSLGRLGGTAVMYDTGKILVLGGGKLGNAPTATAEVIDLNAAAPAWRYTSPMRNNRRHANATLLPDGKVLVTGGSNSTANNNAAGAILAAEQWDPATGAWTTMASMIKPRIYHSTAMLLPDARVLVAGGTKSDGLSYNLQDSQIFWPPYLFQGPRPSIAAAPASITYRSTFVVQTPNAATIDKVRLVRLSSVTHSFNMNQRIATMSFSRTADGRGLAVRAPVNGNRVPPGYYMLFVLNADGVPSIARIINLH